MIVFVSSRIPPDHTGSGKRILSYVDYLIHEKGENVHVITWSLAAKNERIHVPKKSRGRLSLFSNCFHVLKSAKKCINERKKGEPVIFWLISSTYLTFLSALVAKFYGAKIILQSTLDGDDDPLSKTKGSAVYLMKIALYRLSDHVTCVSKPLFNKTNVLYKSVSYIPNPIDLQKFNPGNEKSLGEKKTILFVGALNRRKGIDIVLNTTQKLLAHRDDIKLILVGPYDEAIFEEYGDILAHQDVHIEGYREDTTVYYKQADLFFFPSRREGMPTVLLEAMASRLPIVCKKLENVTDELFPAEYEGVIASEDIDEYYNIILRVLNNKKKIR